MQTSATDWNFRVWAGLVAVCGALFLDGLDVSMVSIALPSIGADLGVSTSQLQWIVSGYVLGFGGLLLLGGRAADLMGRRRVFLVAVSVFALASLLGAVTSDPTLLVATRLIKGASAAFTAPAGLSIITTTFAEGPARNRALSIYTAFGASGFSAGLVLGGLLTELGWRWTFVAPAPFAMAIAIAAFRLIPSDPPTLRLRGFDVFGAIAMSAGMLLLVQGVVNAPEVGWDAPTTVASFAGAAALLVLFIAREQRIERPLVRLGILRSPGLARANLGAMTMSGCFIGFQFMATLYLQSGLGWSAREVALAFLPAGVVVAIGAPRIGVLAARVGTQRLITLGFLAFIAAYALFLRVGPAPDYTSIVLPTILLIGIGFALAFPSLNIQATAGITDHEQGLASGLLQTSGQIGGAIVLAVVSAVLSSQAGTRPDAASLLDATRPALAIVTGVAILGLAAATLRRGGGRERRALAIQAAAGCH
jgi:EmrB/QacA subfamily drug resistance transporter